ncbi:MAG: type II toxin-antitoxin system RelE/ParE family toxin [Thermoplasmata archaeon]|nr:type II toxin-antitoxin system RelE/ParE family toxin [Thermoplasmata archaeon]
MDQSRIKSALTALEVDPFTPRSGAHIKPLSGTTPMKYRIRIGDYRVVYVVEEQVVKVIEVFTRGRGYRP